MILSAVLKNYSDLAVVGALLLVNAILGFGQEYRAAAVVETLRRCLQVRARAFRFAVAADAIIGTAATLVGLPGLRPLPWWQTLTVFVYAMVACLLLNDGLKVVMIKWRVPAGAA